LNIDGCPSTNDTVIVMASGASGVTPDPLAFGLQLTEVCSMLAKFMAADAEGASRVVSLGISGTPDDATARRLGMAVADSALVRASFYGGDPNWGRILGAMGATDIPFDPRSVSISFAGVTVAEAGIGADFDEAALISAIADGDFDVAVSIGAGPGTATVLTTDLTPDYVRFNGERS
jgi:glutamate N-acetyltransferase/amino-acid N-acetyltransferase